MTPQQKIEYQILTIMRDLTPDEYLWGYYLPFRAIIDENFLDVEIVRGFLRSMRNRGYVEYGHGFNEEGEVAGAGYTITLKGDAYRKTLQVH